MNRWMGFFLAMLLGLFSVPALAGENHYDHSIDAGNIQFGWRLDDTLIHVRVKAKTKGWVAVGFNPDNMMQGANIIMGYVKGNQVFVSDQYGSRKRNHREDVKAGGENHVLNAEGSEAGGITEIRFSFPLDTGDSYDKPIARTGKTLVMLAHGSKRDRFKGAHKFRTLYKVDLSTGARQKLK